MKIKTCIQTATALAVACSGLLGITGCNDDARDATCYDRNPHHWGQWEDLGRNELGYMWQKRYCTNCHQIQMAAHK